MVPLINLTLPLTSGSPGITGSKLFNPPVIEGSKKRTPLTSRYFLRPLIGKSVQSLSGSVGLSKYRYHC